MGTSRIPLRRVLEPEQEAAIDAFRAGAAADDHAGIAAFLRDRLQTELSLDPDIVGGFLSDSSNLEGRAWGLARPASERECAAVLRLCSGPRIPVTVSAGRSNLTGSATPEGGILLSTCNLMTPAVALDPAARSAVAPVGMIFEDVRRAIEQQSKGVWHLPVDPTSRADASIGGVLACNASGFTPGAAGAIRDWVRSLDVVLPDGSAVRARRGDYVSENGAFTLVRGDGPAARLPVPRYRRPAIKNASGPFSAEDGVMDFVDFIVGSEGLYGVVTAASFDLAPRPPETLDLFFSLPSEEAALKLYGVLMRKLGSFDGLTAFEYFGVNCRTYMNHAEALFSGDDPVGLNIQAPVFDGVLEAAAETWLTLLMEADCGIREEAILMLDNERTRAIFMDARHSMPANAVEEVRRRGTFTLMTDTVVPADRFARFLADTHALIRGHGIDYLSFGHFGDCHLHFTMLPRKEQLETARQVYDRIIERSAELGGVYSGEHGTGKRKRADFLKCYGEAAAEQVRAAKRAVDPGFVLNRGNVVTPP